MILVSPRLLAILLAQVPSSTLPGNLLLLCRRVARLGLGSETAEILGKSLVKPKSKSHVQITARPSARAGPTSPDFLSKRMQGWM